MSERRDRKLTAGVVLIVVGLAFFASSKMGYLRGELILAILGAAFLAAYLVLGRYGLLIPGCILTGLGLGSLLGDGVVGASSAKLGLGLGFLAIYALAWLRERQSHWWPLIPGGILTLSAIHRMEEAMGYLFQNWPLILVAVGVALLIGGLATRRDDGEKGEGETSSGV